MDGTGHRQYYRGFGHLSEQVSPKAQRAPVPHFPTLAKMVEGFGSALRLLPLLPRRGTTEGRKGISGDLEKTTTTTNAKRSISCAGSSGSSLAPRGRPPSPLPSSAAAGGRAPAWRRCPAPCWRPADARLEAPRPPRHAAPSRCRCPRRRHQPRARPRPPALRPERRPDPPPPRQPRRAERAASCSACYGVSWVGRDPTGIIQEERKGRQIKRKWGARDSFLIASRNTQRKGKSLLATRVAPVAPTDSHCWRNLWQL